MIAIDFWSNDQVRNMNEQYFPQTHLTLRWTGPLFFFSQKLMPKKERKSKLKCRGVDPGLLLIRSQDVLKLIRWSCKLVFFLKNKNSSKKFYRIIIQSYNTIINLIIIFSFLLIHIISKRNKLSGFLYTCYADRDTADWDTYKKTWKKHYDEKPFLCSY
jgi:hypothetical protein